MAGDGNRAAYLCTPKNPGGPTCEVNLLQFWINRMINTAAQSRIKNNGPSPPARAKHFITCSYNDLVHLSHHLRNIKTETYTTELAQKTDGYGDCCTLTLLEWGHARNEFTEDVKDFGSDDRMRWMKFTWVETIGHSWLHPRTGTLTNRSSYMLLQLIWLAESSALICPSWTQDGQKGTWKGEAEGHQAQVMLWRRWGDDLVQTPPSICVLAHVQCCPLCCNWCCEFLVFVFHVNFDVVNLAFFLFT